MDKLIIKHGAGIPSADALYENELGFDTLGGVLYIGTANGPVALMSALLEEGGGEGEPI